MGPTASGKTKLAVSLALKINGEIISADSRQVYKGMDIGTGKDLKEYDRNGQKIPYHLIDICEPGEKFLLPDYQREFRLAFDKITSNQKTPILCGGTGLYLEAIINNYKHTQIPEDVKLRTALNKLSHSDLHKMYLKLKKIENHFPDLSTRKRIIRAIEVNQYLQEHQLVSSNELKFSPIIFGLDIERELRRQKITSRLRERLSTGLIEEVENLLAKGISAEQLKYYGLEYKFVTEHIEGKWDQYELFNKLETAIHQYAKRQMTWFRRMERNGLTIHWLEATSTTEKKLNIVSELI